MNTEQPLAIALAETLERQFPEGTAHSFLDGEAAAELRRLHAENEAAHRVGILQEKELMRLEAENEALREAINKFITEELTVGQRYTNAGQCLLDALARASEAIGEVK